MNEVEYNGSTEQKNWENRLDRKNARGLQGVLRSVPSIYLLAIQSSMSIRKCTNNRQ